MDSQDLSMGKIKGFKLWLGWGLFQGLKTFSCDLIHFQVQQSLTQRTEAFNAEGDRSESFLTAEWSSLQNILLHVINPRTHFTCFIATGSQQRWPSKILSTFIDLTVHVIQPCPVFASWSQSVIICKFLTESALSEEDIYIMLLTHTSDHNVFQKIPNSVSPQR